MRRVWRSTKLEATINDRPVRLALKREPGMLDVWQWWVYERGQLGGLLDTGECGSLSKAKRQAARVAYWK